MHFSDCMEDSTVTRQIYGDSVDEGLIAAHAAFGARSQ